MQKLIDLCIDAITGGTRPIRIFIFGGTILALLIWMAVTSYFQIAIGGDESFDWTNAAVLVVSILCGFGTAFGVIHFADHVKRKRS